MTQIELTIERSADGGAGVGRQDSGRVVFAAGALPGERVAVELTQERKRHARGHVLRVIESSPDRITPLCTTAQAGCGGCDLAHATTDLQHDIKRSVVRDALVRIGRLTDATVDAVLAPTVRTATAGPVAYRTTVRAAIANGRAGYRQARSHDVVTTAVCRVTHPLLEELFGSVRFDDGAGVEARMRISVATGERSIVIDGDSSAVHAPSDVSVASMEQLRSGRQEFITETAAGRSWRVSALSFFQAGPGVATELAEMVGDAVGDLTTAHVVDAYAGVGLFAGSVAADAARITTIERSGSSTEDAKVNLEGLPAHIIEADVDDWIPEPADVVIADPARAGLGSAGVDVLSQTGAERFVLVSCDPGSLGRDTGLLVEAGYTLERVEMLDAFADTSHIESVAVFIR